MIVYVFILVISVVLKMSLLFRNRMLSSLGRCQVEHTKKSKILREVQILRLF